MIPPRMLRREARSKNVVLEESFGVRLDSAAPEQGFLPRRQGAAEVERKRCKCPDNGGEMEVDHGGPPEDEETPEQHERNVRHMDGNDHPREQTVDHSPSRPAELLDALVFSPDWTEDW